MELWGVGRWCLSKIDIIDLECIIRNSAYSECFDNSYTLANGRDGLDIQTR